MHASAYKTAQQFFDTYVAGLSSGTVMEVGSRQAAEEQRTLRTLCPGHLEYLGLDMELGANVDVVLDDPYAFPFPDASADVVLCTSVFEHSFFFWELFEQILRLLKPGGLLYLNAPSNGYVHRYPVDCWRFYPDSGVALAEWGLRKGHDICLLESFITDEDVSENSLEIWNDFVAVFVKGKSEAVRYPKRISNLRNDYVNARRPGTPDLLLGHLFPGRSRREAESARKMPGRGIHLYHIAYSDETLASAPERMLPLDNLANERPDWREYWPIRKFLQGTVLDENAFYGFFSPRFSEKMLMAPSEVHDFIATVPEDVDVVTASPFHSTKAVFLNLFEQGEFSHPGLMDISQRVIDEAMPGVKLRDLINTAETGVFCNYFAAKPSFWKEWLAVCEQIFRMAESSGHPCAALLNHGFGYRGAATPAKVFVIERIASMLLAAKPEFKAVNFPKSTLDNWFGDLPHALLSSLNGLKSGALGGNPNLVNAFRHIQREILGKESVKAMRAGYLRQGEVMGSSLVHSKGYEHWEGTSSIQGNRPAKTGLGWFFQQLLARR